MQMTIQFNDTDADLLSGFATQTGWTEASGVTQADWAAQVTEKWLRQQAVAGFVAMATADTRSAYVAAIQATQKSAVVRQISQATVPPAQPPIKTVP